MVERSRFRSRRAAFWTASIVGSLGLGTVLWNEVLLEVVDSLSAAILSGGR